MKYINVGSGSKGNSTIVYDEATTVLIDCGVSKKRVVECLNRIGRDASFLDAVFLTHRHSDHAAHLESYSSLHQSIYAGDPFLLGEAEKEENRLSPFQEIAVKNLSVIALPTAHDAPDSMGYLFQERDREEKLLYMTDTGFVPERDLPYMKDCDYYLIESNHDPKMLLDSARSNYLKMRILGTRGHMSNEQCSHYLSLLVGKKTKEIAFAHLSEECNRPEIAVRVFQEIMLAQTGEVPDVVLKTLRQREPTEGGDVG